MKGWLMVVERRRGVTFLIVAGMVLFFAAGLRQASAPSAIPVASHRLFGPPLGQDGGPEVKSPAVILIDADSGQVLFEKEAGESRPPASITKLMTLELIMDALAAGRISLDDTMTVSAHAESFGGAEMYLEQGERLKLEDILYGIALFSANDGSVAMAEHIAGSVENFSRMMNRRARELGMTDSHFENPHGLPGNDNHVMSARDIAILSRHLVNEHPELLKYTSTWEHWIRKGTKAELWMTNFNKALVEYPGTDGLKTGFTNEAGFNLSATATRGGRRMIAVVMGAAGPKERNGDIYRLLDYGFSGFDTVWVADKDGTVASVRVFKGVGKQAELVPSHPVAVTVPRGEKENVSSEVTTEETVVAPVRRGQVLGAITVKQGGREVARADLIAAGAVPRAGLPLLTGRCWRYLWIPAVEEGAGPS